MVNTITAQVRLKAGGNSRFPVLAEDLVGVPDLENKPCSIIFKYILKKPLKAGRYDVLWVRPLCGSQP